MDCLCLCMHHENGRRDPDPGSGGRAARQPRRPQADGRCSGTRSISTASPTTDGSRDNTMSTPDTSTLPDAALGHHEPDPHRWRALALVCVAFFMTVLDGTIVTVALPSIK